MSGETSATRPEGAQARVSVVIPSLNSGLFVGAAVESALSQDPPPHEVIVQDGGSTDETLDVLRSFADRIRWRSEPDRGQSDALNRATGRAKGDVVVWLNADDLLVAGAFQAVQAAFDDHAEADFVFGDFAMVDVHGATVRTFRSAPYDPTRVFTHGCYIFSGAIFYRRALLDRIGPFDPRFHACMDFDYLMRIGEAQGVHVGRTVAKFRISDSQKSATMRSRFLEESYAIRRRAAGSSLKLRLLSLLLTARDSVYLLTARGRQTRAWGAFRGTRRL